MNKKLLTGIIVMFLLVSAISAGAATWSGLAKEAVNKVTSGFKEPTKEGAGSLSFYDQHTQLWDFIIFFVIFLSIAYLGLRQWLKDEKTAGAVKGLTIAIAAALALATLKAGISVTFFIPFVKNALFFITYMVVFLILLKLTASKAGTGDAAAEKKHPFICLILAFVITWVMFNFAGLVGKERTLPWEGNDQEKLTKLEYQLQMKNDEIAAFEAKMSDEGFTNMTEEGFTNRTEGFANRAALQKEIEDLEGSKDSDDKKKKNLLKGYLKKWDNLYKGGLPWEKGKIQLEAEIAALRAKIEEKELAAGTQPGTTTPTAAGSATTPEAALTFSSSDGQIKLTCSVTKESTVIRGRGTVRYRYQFQSDAGAQFWKETTDESAEITVSKSQGNRWICTIYPFVEGPAGAGGTATAMITLPPEIEQGDIFANEDLMIKALEDLSE